jgi:rhodanese-related sulfurtransferase
MRMLVLSALIGLAAPAALAEPQTPEAASFPTVSSETFASHPDGAVLIDVRQPAEWAATGMPADSKGVTLQRPDFVDAVLAELGGDRTRPVAVICRSGSRSVKAAEQLSNAGFTHVTNIGDGMMGREGVGQGWLAAKLPTQTYTPQGQ